MENRVLRYFLAVAREGSVTGAAKLLHLTQPTLTRQLKDLEKELGQQLLIRTNHNISLTPEGMILKKRAQEIIDMVDKTEEEFRNIKDTISGEIFIGGGETAVIKYIAQIINELKSEYPNIKYHIYSAIAEDVTDRLDKGLLDFGILIQPTDISKYEYLSLPEKDVWGLIMRKDSPLSKKDYITVDDLLNIPLLTSKQVTQRISTKNDYINWFGDKLEKLNIAATYNLIYNAAIMVNEGVGHAIGLDNLVQVTGSTNLCFKPFYPRIESGLNIVWKKYQVFSPAARVFLSKIQEKFTKT